MTLRVICKILGHRPCHNFLPGVLCVAQGHRITSYGSWHAHKKNKTGLPTGMSHSTACGWSQVPIDSGPVALYLLQWPNPPLLYILLCRHSMSAHFLPSHVNLSLIVQLFILTNEFSLLLLFLKVVATWSVFESNLIPSSCRSCVTMVRTSTALLVDSKYFMAF